MAGEIIILQPHLPLSLQPLSPPLLPFCSRKCCSSKGSGCLKIKQTNTENTTVPSAKASLPDLTPGVFQLFLLFFSITLRLCLKLKIASFNILIWSSFSSPRDKLCPKRMEISWMLSSHTERFPFVMYLLLETSCQAMEALLFSPCLPAILWPLFIFLPFSLLMDVPALHALQEMQLSGEDGFCAFTRLFSW